VAAAGTAAAEAAAIAGATTAAAAATAAVGVAGCRGTRGPAGANVSTGTSMMLRLSWDCARFGDAGPAAVKGTTTVGAADGAAAGILRGDEAPLHAAETTTGTTSVVRWLARGGVAATVIDVAPGVGCVSTVYAGTTTDAALAAIGGVCAGATSTV